MAAKAKDTEEFLETNSSGGDHTDALNDEQARLAADPALQPALAWERDAAAGEGKTKKK